MTQPYDSLDGLPTIEPTREHVGDFLNEVDRSPDEAVGEIAPSYTAIDVETIAVKPEKYMTTVIGISGRQSLFHSAFRDSMFVTKPINEDL